MRPAPGPAARGSLEDWKASLLSGSGDGLIAAARNYVGEVKTPYNKHEIVDRLESFLRRPGTAEAVAALADREDAAALTAFALLGPLTEREALAFLAGIEKPYALGLRLPNLRDRLLLYETGKAGSRALAPCPILAPALRALLYDPRALFECAPAEGPAPSGPSLTDELALAGLSVLGAEKSPVLADGKLGKRARDRLLAIAPEFADETLLSSFLESLAALGALGPGRPFERGLVPSETPSLVFALAGALAGEADPARADSGADGSASLCASIPEAMPEGMVFAESGLARLAAYLLLGDVPEAARAEASVETALDRGGRAVRALLRLGVLSRAGGGLRRSAVSFLEGMARGKKAALEGLHGLLLLPSASPSERALASSFARLEGRSLSGAGWTWRMAIDARSVREAFASGMDAAAVKDALRDLCGEPPPQALAFQVDAWHEDAASLSLERGLVIVARGPKLAAIEHSPALRGVIGKRLSEGVWLAASEDYEELARAFEKAGLAAPKDPRTGARRPASPEPRAAQAAGALSAPPVDWGGGPLPPRDPSAAREAIASAIEAAMGPGARTEELKERAARGLVLGATQAREASVEAERLEAGSLDYSGKARIIERVMRHRHELVELDLGDRGDGAPAKARPLSLSKGPSGLELEAIDAESGQKRRFALGDLRSVKRIRASLFGEDNEG